MKPDVFYDIVKNDSGEPVVVFKTDNASIMLSNQTTPAGFYDLAYLIANLQSLLRTMSDQERENEKVNSGPADV